MTHRRFSAGPLAWCLSILFWVGGVQAEPPKTESEKAAVTLHEETVFFLRRGDAVQTLAERARRASQALATAASAPSAPDVHAQRNGERVTILAGETPVVELEPEDARSAGDASLDLHAASIIARMRVALEHERRRASVANTVFSVSLVVFFGLITVYLMGRVSQLAQRARSFVLEHPDAIPALRLKSVDVVGAASLRNVGLVGLSLARVGSLFGLAYAWLVLSFSLFESTRPYTQKLTGFVVSPLTSLVGRMATALPVFAVVIAAAGVLTLLVRLSDLFFQSVGRGETHVSWLAAETASAAGLSVRICIALFALIVVGPLITGDGDGALSRTGMILLIALAAAAVPALTSVIAGISTVFSRSLKLGDHVDYGGERGVVREIGVLSMTLEADDGCTVRVPHARSLWHATRILARSPR